jgi:PAS domain S-box-containing protein
MSHPNGPEQSRLILNVDDYAPTLYARSAFLRREGFEVIEADTGRGALALVRERIPDLVVLDIGLPDVSGFEVCRTIKADPVTSSVMVLQVSATFTDPSSRVRSLEAGSDGYLAGSAEPEEVVATVRALLRIRRVEQALKQSELRFRALFEGAAVGMATVGLDGRIGMVNGSLARLLGCPPDELSGRHFREVLHPLGRDEEERMLGRLTAAGTESGYIWEGRYARSDGEVLWARTAVSVVPERVGSAKELLAIVEDITGRRRAEEDRDDLLVALETERRRLQTVLEQMPAGVMIAGAPTGKLLMANRRIDEIWRQPFAAANGIADYNKWKGFRPSGEPYLPAEWPLARSVLHGDVVVNEEAEIVRGDGSRATILMSSAPVRDADGAISAAVLTEIDITERKRAEMRQRFLADAAKALATLDHSRVVGRLSGIVVPAFADFCVIFLSEHESEHEAPRLTSAHAAPDKEDALRRLAAAIASEHDRLGRLMRDREPVLVPDVTEGHLAQFCRTSDQADMVGRLGIGSVMLLPLFSGARPLGVMALGTGRAESARDYDRQDLAVAEELASRIAAAMDNARLYKATQEANRLKDEFLATLSHELRTPLNAILGWVQMLKARVLDPETAARALDAIDRNARLQTQLISEILDVSRIIRGKLRLDRQEVGLSALVDAAWESERFAVEAKNIRVTKQVDESIRLDADPQRLQQILWNLLSNAVKFTPEGGEIEIRALRDDSQVEFTVRDSGVGIGPHFLPHVFDRFRQADASTTRVHGGLGLGLSIVKHLVESHGGSIVAESEGRDRGATFRVRLPVTKGRAADVSGAAVLQRAPEPKVLEDSEEEDLELAQLDGIRVLVIDDHGEARSLLSAILEHEGVETFTAGTAAEGRRVLEQTRPDVMIVDIAMPEEDGYSFIRSVRDVEVEGFGIPALALTAYASESDRVRAMDAGYQAFLSKPVSRTALLRTVATLAGMASRNY